MFDYVAQCKINNNWHKINDKWQTSAWRNRWHSSLWTQLVLQRDFDGVMGLFRFTPPPFFGGEGRMVTHSNLVAILLSICHLFIALIKLVRYLKYRISVTVYTTNYSTCVNYIILSFKHCFWQVDINVWQILMPTCHIFMSTYQKIKAPSCTVHSDMVFKL